MHKLEEYCGCSRGFYRFGIGAKTVARGFAFGVGGLSSMAPVVAETWDLFHPVAEKERERAYCFGCSFLQKVCSVQTAEQLKWWPIGIGKLNGTAHDIHTYDGPRWAWSTRHGPKLHAWASMPAQDLGQAHLISRAIHLRHTFFFITNNNVNNSHFD